MENTALTRGVRRSDTGSKRWKPDTTKTTQLVEFLSVEAVWIICASYQSPVYVGASSFLLLPTHVHDSLTSNFPSRYAAGERGMQLHQRCILTSFLTVASSTLPATRIALQT
jgi:hypothetical protein